MFDLKQLSTKFNSQLEKLLEKQIVQDVPKTSIVEPKTKLGIYLTTSGMKTHLLGREIMTLVEENRFFPAIATLRMIFEETLLLILILSKMQSKKTWNEAYYILTKVNIGRKSRDEIDVRDEQNPYNIVTALDIADKYLSKMDTKLKGMLDETYTVISDFVHPNAPSRYIFWQEAGEKIKFVYRKKVGDQDLGMILNYSNITLDIYMYSWEKLKEIKLT